MANGGQTQVRPPEDFNVSEVLLLAADGEIYVCKYVVSSVIQTYNRTRVHGIAMGSHAIHGFLSGSHRVLSVLIVIVPAVSLHFF